MYGQIIPFSMNPDQPGLSTCRGCVSLVRISLYGALIRHWLNSHVQLKYCFAIFIAGHEIIIFSDSNSLPILWYGIMEYRKNWRNSLIPLSFAVRPVWPWCKCKAIWWRDRWFYHFGRCCSRFSPPFLPRWCRLYEYCTRWCWASYSISLTLKSFPAESEQTIRWCKIFHPSAPSHKFNCSSVLELLVNF